VNWVIERIRGNYLILDADDLDWERYTQARLTLPCSRCHQRPVIVGGEAHDACIARLPSVRFACCGHDRTEIDACYVAFDDGVTLYGPAARAAMETMGGSPPPPAA